MWIKERVFYILLKDILFYSCRTVFEEILGLVWRLMIQVNNEDQKMWPFDASKTKLSTKFMAGRGKVLLERSKLPLQAQEFAKRKKIQELLLKGELKLDQNNIPEDLLRLNCPYTVQKKSKPNDMRSFLPGGELIKDLNSPYSRSDYKTQKIISNSNATEYGNQYRCTEVDIEKKNIEMPSSRTNMELHEFFPVDTPPKDYNRIKNGMGARPLRKPEKSRKQYIDQERTKSNEIDILNNSRAEEFQGKMVHEASDKDAWIDWENSVVVQGSLADEDLSKIATLEDNDDINDIMVNQYVDSLQHEQNNEILKQKSKHKLTPNRVQQFSKLKSTANADCLRLSPGTQPNLPKGDNRWGGSELNCMGSNMGWGTLENESINQYDDGSSMWSAGGSHYGGPSWSKSS